MSYIGAQPTTAAFVTDQFSANGSGTVFTLSVAPANTNSILVAVSGVLQSPDTYSVSGTTLTFSAAPPAGTGNISVRFLGIPASGVTNTAYRTQTEFTATAGQTTFSVPSYTVGFIDVYRNGALLGSADFTATNGTTVVLANPASSGDLIETVSFYVSSVLNAIPAQNNAVIDSYILSMAGSKLTGTQVIPKAALPTGSVLQVASTDYQVELSLASATYTEITGLNTTFTPSSSSSKVLVTGTLQVATNSNTGAIFRLYRNSTVIGRDPFKWFYSGNSGSNSDTGATVAWCFLDSPATTSPVTYKVYWRCDNGAHNIFLNRTEVNTTFEKGGSQLTIMEIAA